MRGNEDRHSITKLCHFMSIRLILSQILSILKNIEVTIMMKFAICDDEPFMLDDIAARLGKYMEKKSLLYQINCFANGRALLQSNKTFDVLFLDIQMEAPDGLETARLLREQGYHGLLIYITILRERVFDSFAVQAFDYLVKPVEDSRFQNTMERALRFLEQQASKNIIVQKGNNFQIVPFSSIIYCEVLDRKIYLYQQNGEMIDYYDKLADVEKRLDSRFFKCHRSYLVNLDYVYGCRAGRVVLLSGSEIPVSRLREQQLIQALLVRMKERQR